MFPRTLTLDTGWQVDYRDGDLEQPLPTPDAADMPDLSAWRADDRPGEDARLTCSFTLAPTDFCVGYQLRIDSAPHGTRLFVNGQDVGEIGHKLRVDVTNYVALDDNTLAFHVPRGAPGIFAGVSLVAVPCE